MKLLRKIAALFRREKMEAEMSEEMRLHLEQRVRENIARGISEDEARYAALRRFGGVEQAKEIAREQWSWVWLEQLKQDVRQALRSFARNPGFTSVVLLSLALGIGANTAIFSLLDTVLWKMLPVAQPEELVLLERLPRGDTLADRKFCGIPFSLMEALERRESLLAGMTTFAHGTGLVNVNGEASPVSVLTVADDFYSLVGINAQAGRLIRPGDTRAGDIVVLGHGYWQRQFGGRAVVGESMIVNGSPHTIVGVAPPEFFGIAPGDAFDLSIPFREKDLDATAAPLDPATHPLFHVLARLKPGVTGKQAAHSLTALLRQMMREDSRANAKPAEIERSGIGVRPASRGLNTLRAKFSQPLLALMALVALVLLITCANVANLLLARAAARGREMAIRASLGAGRLRLVRQLMTESLLLAFAGGALGLILAHWAAEALVRFAGSGGQPIALHATLDYRALAFTLGVSLLAGIFFGLAPAWRGAESGSSALHGRAKLRGATLSRLSRALIAGQVALSLVLLVGSGLFVRSLRNLKQLDGGFRRDNILLVAIDPRPAGVSGGALADLYQQLLERIVLLPGVESLSFERNTPLGGAASTRPLAPAGYRPPGGGTNIQTFTEEVGPHFFEATGLSLVAGRDFTLRDNRHTARVVVINEAAARQFFPGENPIGRRLGRPANPTELEIVGVARDARHRSLREEPQPTVYLPSLQDPGIRDTTLVIRTNVESLTLAPQVRQIVRAAHPGVAIMGVTTMQRVAERSLLQERLTASLASVFGGLALALAGVGIGGVLLFAVTRRTQEIGVRMALGATPRAVVAMVMCETLRLVAIGTVVGLPCAWLAGRAAGSLLFGLTPTDPVVMISAAALLTLMALAAAWWPAHRAARVDPMTALRAE